MKHLILIPAVVFGLISCRAEVDTAPGGSSTTVVKPEAEKTVENNTTVVKPDSGTSTSSTTTTVK
jgi:hypothetical protein